MAAIAALLPLAAPDSTERTCRYGRGPRRDLELREKRDLRQVRAHVVGAVRRHAAVVVEADGGHVMPIPAPRAVVATCGVRPGSDSSGKSS